MHKFITARPIGHPNGDVAYWDAVYVGMRAPGCFETAFQAAENAHRYFGAEQVYDRDTDTWSKVGYDWQTAPGRIAGLA